jgi:hypothetical protein
MLNGIPRLTAANRSKDIAGRCRLKPIHRLFIAIGGSAWRRPTNDGELGGNLFALLYHGCGTEGAGYYGVG